MVYFKNKTEIIPIVKETNQLLEETLNGPIIPRNHVVNGPTISPPDLTPLANSLWKIKTMKKIQTISDPRDTIIYIIIEIETQNFNKNIEHMWGC